MKIKYRGEEVRLSHDKDSGAMALYDADGEMIDRVDATPGEEAFQPNMIWTGASFMAVLVGQMIADPTGKTAPLADGTTSHQLAITHPALHDGGYSCFGDFARTVLDEQCQYASRYIDGRMEGYQVLGEGLRFQNVGGGDYHAIRIHREDMAEFENRYLRMKADRRTH